MLLYKRHDDVIAGGKLGYSWVGQTSLRFPSDGQADMQVEGQLSRSLMLRVCICICLLSAFHDEAIQLAGASFLNDRFSDTGLRFRTCSIRPLSPQTV